MNVVYELVDVVTGEVVPQSLLTDSLVEQIAYQWCIRSPDNVVHPSVTYLPENKGSMDVQFMLTIKEPWACNPA
tara:strand:- start:31 stop:252 length:222 start_codon:yes stop_codon:yes gene_type:complete